MWLFLAKMGRISDFRLWSHCLFCKLQIVTWNSVILTILRFLELDYIQIQILQQIIRKTVSYETFFYFGFRNPDLESSLDPSSKIVDRSVWILFYQRGLGIVFWIRLDNVECNFNRAWFWSSNSNLDQLFNFDQPLDFDCSSFASLEFPKFALHHHQTLDS